MTPLDVVGWGFGPFAYLFIGVLALGAIGILTALLINAIRRRRR